MTSATKYVQMEWKIKGVTRDSVKFAKNLQSQKFDLNFCESGKLRWCFQFQTKANTNKIITSEIEDPDEPLELDEDSTGDCCGLMLSLLETIHFDISNSFLNYRCYIVDKNRDQKLQFGVSNAKLKSFGCDGTEGGYGNKLSWNRIFNNQYIENETLTLSFLIEIHTRTAEIIQAPRPFEYLLKTGSFSDFTIVCNDREIAGHCAIINSYAEGFFHLLKNNITPDKKVKIDSFEGKIVERIMRYIYSGKTDKLRGTDEKVLLDACDKFQIKDLKKEIIDSMSAQINMKNVFETLELASNYDEDILLKNCVVFIKAQRNKIMDLNPTKMSTLLIKIIDIGPVAPLANKLSPAIM